MELINNSPYLCSPTRKEKELFLFCFSYPCLKDLKIQEKEKNEKTREILKEVYKALTEKGYNPINQIVGYILSGDPTYITSHNGARNLIRQVERDELLEEMVKNYIGLDK